MPWKGLTADAIVELHDRVLEGWESGAGASRPDAPRAKSPAAGPDGPSPLAALVEAAHFANFSIWHLEDEARRRDVGDARIAATKRAIDAWNQKRNDLMEAVDEAVLAALPAPASGAAQHSETAGMILDRLGVLALKIRNAERVAAEARAGGDAALADECDTRRGRLAEQRTDLAACLARLLDDCADGRRYFKRYLQLKSYNDDRLNLALRSSADARDSK